MINTDHPIRIAIAGLGFGESVHIPASLSNKNIELVGLWHPRPERLSDCLLYTSPSPRDRTRSRMPSSA